MNRLARPVVEPNEVDGSFRTSLRLSTSPMGEKSREFRADSADSLLKTIQSAVKRTWKGTCAATLRLFADVEVQ